MTLQLSLPPELERRLRAAASRTGKPVDELAVQVLDAHLPATDPAGAVEMLLRWANEDAALTDTESAENEALLRAIDADRLSERKLFTHLLDGTTP